MDSAGAANAVCSLAPRSGERVGVRGSLKRERSAWRPSPGRDCWSNLEPSPHFRGARAQAAMVRPPHVINSAPIRFRGDAGLLN